jgi:hypothetical protein
MRVALHPGGSSFSTAATAFSRAVAGPILNRRGPAIETRRSFYLASQHDDFAELPIDTDRLNAINASNLPYNMPANDNVL